MSPVGLWFAVDTVIGVKGFFGEASSAGMEA
jgi:hypothetical protein